MCAVPKKNNVCFQNHLSNYGSDSETAYVFGWHDWSPLIFQQSQVLTCIFGHWMFQSEIDNSTDFKWVENLFFEHVFSSGTVCTQWHVVWCINWLIEAELKWSDPELGQAVWLPLTEMKTCSGGLLCVDMFILHCSISEELQDKAVIHLHHHCLESRTLFASFDS